jgi:hypothetical protein
VKQTKQLASRVAAVIAVATLVGTSAFAESRPSKGTSSRGEGRGQIRREGASGSSERSRGSASRDESRNAAPRERSVSRDESRNAAPRERSVTRDNGRIGRDTERGATQQQRDGARAERDGNRDRSRENGGGYQRWEDRDGVEENRRGETYRDRSSNDRRGANDRWRDNNRNGSSRGGAYGSRTNPYWGNGRISNVHRYSGGYRVWIIGSPYPFFISDRYWNRDRFRVGLSIRLGGYYNPGGYYDYYDGYYDRAGYSTGEIRGVVESVDHRRDTFVIRNEYTGSFVTVVLRDRRSDVRAGDYVEIYGDWSRSGVFNARDVDFLSNDDRRYDRR